MSIKKYLTTGPFYEITKYSADANYTKDNVAYTGTPRRHPYDKGKIILIADPLSSNTAFYEFKLDNITHVDEVSRLVSTEGESIQLVKLWVKKGSIALKYEPFIVNDTSAYLEESEI